MNIFLSWSGARSKCAAQAFSGFFSQFFFWDTPVIYLSTSTEKGVYWDEKLEKALDEADFGVLFLTRENCGNPSPWMMYEAGVLSRTAGPKGIDSAKRRYVMTFLLDGSASDIPSPVSRMQSAVFDKSDIIEMAYRMYILYEKKSGMPEDRIKEYAAFCYDNQRLEEKLNNAVEMDSKSEYQAPWEPTQRLAEENQTLLRRISRGQNRNHLPAGKAGL